MKKFLFIALVLVGLAAVSCSKQDIQPIKGNPAVPTWRGGDDGGGDLGKDDGGTIVDPEHDPEESGPVGSDN